MNIRRNILLFGKSAMLGVLAADLRACPLLDVIEREEVAMLNALRPDVALVDALQVTPEQFSELLPICPTILSVDPETRQLTILSAPHQVDLTETARVIEELSFILHPPA